MDYGAQERHTSANVFQPCSGAKNRGLLLFEPEAVFYWPGNTRLAQR